MTRGSLTRIVGALAEVTDVKGVALNELVRVGDRQLLAEVLRVSGDVATLQVFEETTGVRVGEPVARDGLPLAVELGPGLLGTVIDGIGRPLGRLAEMAGTFIQPGQTAPTLDRAKRYRFTPSCAIGDRVEAGDVLGTVEERGGFALKVMVPPGRAGEVRSIREGEVAVDDGVVHLGEGDPITLLQKWPVRRPRPSALRLETPRPFITGQRIFDLLFPGGRGRHGGGARRVRHGQDRDRTGPRQVRRC